MRKIHRYSKDILSAFSQLHGRLVPGILFPSAGLELGAVNNAQYYIQLEDGSSTPIHRYTLSENILFPLIRYISECLVASNFLLQLNKTQHFG